MIPSPSPSAVTRADDRQKCAVAPDNKPVAAGEVRWLDQAYLDPSRWSLLTRRIRLLNLLHHPACVQPLDVDLEASPPYLILPVRGDFPGRLRVFQAVSWGATLASLLVEAHRLGLCTGPLTPELLFVADNGDVAVDLTCTAPSLTADALEDRDPAEDVASLADLLESLTKDESAYLSVDGAWRILLEEMRSPRLEERPLPEDVLARLQSFDVSQTCEDGKPSTKRPRRVDATCQKDIANFDTPAAGGCLGRFRLLECIGAGAVGQVFRAVDQADGSLVAIKVLHPRIGATEVARKRFLREGRVLAHLQSPNITHLIEANHDGDCCYLAIEYIAGRDLAAVLDKQGRFDERTGLSMIADAARGLAVAHARGIIHRDIKPGNLLLDETQLSTGTGSNTGNAMRVKVTDFGLARGIEQTESMAVTQAGALLGTPLYMAPEQFRSDNPLDARADVYALGATLFHLLAGRPPFVSTSFQEVMNLHLTEPPPALDRLVPEISAATADLVNRTLSKEPSYRPADAGALLREIERLLSGESSGRQDHPLVPSGTARSRTYVYTWELNATPQRLWPLISNTERLNRAAGLPVVQYTFRSDPHMGTRRFATARVGGLYMEWEEHAFEWVEGRRMGVLREFSRGPFRWFLSIVELIPRPGGGTTLRQTCRVEPRGLFGHLAAYVELGLKTKGALGRVYRSIDAYLSLSDSAAADADPFEEPTRLSAARQKRLRACLSRLVGRGASAQITDLLGLFLSNATPQELARIRPRILARRFGLEEKSTCDICLRAVIEGLLLLRWDVICPSCRLPSGRKGTLGDLADHESCPACNIRFQTDFTANVELVFEVHPDIGKSEVGRYCAGGPAHSPHVIAQMRVAPGEKMELPLSLPDGIYRLRGPQLPWAAEIRVAASGLMRHWEIDLGATKEPRLLTLAPGGQVLTLNNTRTHDLMVRFERSAMAQDAWTAAQVQALPTFRVLFPGELRTPAHLTPPAMMTFLFTQADHGDIQDNDDTHSLNTLHASFVAQQELIHREGGTVIKTIKEGVCAVFRESASATRAALALGSALASNEDTHSLRIRGALHRGLARVVTINEHLDYYGSVLTMGYELLEQASPGEVLLPALLASDPEVEPLLSGYSLTVADIRRPDGEALLAYRVTLSMGDPGSGIG